MTLPRRSRAERRREGLLPDGEDPLLRRPSPAGARPAPAVPPVAGRRRTDRPGPAPATGDVPTSASAAPEALARGTVEVGRDRLPDRPASSPEAAGATSLFRRAGDFRRVAEASSAQGWADPPAPAAPQTTHLPLTPGPPTPAPEGEPGSAGELFDGTGEWSAPSPVAAPALAPAPAPAPVSVAGPDQPTVQVPAAEDPGPATDGARELRAGAPAQVAGPGSGPVGGRAAARLERQAAEAAARKGRRAGATAAPRPAREGVATGGRAAVTTTGTRDSGVEAGARTGRGTPGRAVQLLVAAVVVALVVLGVWSFTSPRTEEASSGSPAGSSAPASSSAPAVDAAPATPSVPPAAVVPPGPVRVPVTVLNSTRITGLAGDVAEEFTSGGWPVNTPGAYSAADVAATTVFYAAGDPVQEEAANQLVEQYPDLVGPAVRFFDLPGVPDPGLVVVATGNWRP